MERLSVVQIDEIKAKMCVDPEIRTLCRTLGVSVERFLEDIEKQGESCELVDECEGG